MKKQVLKFGVLLALALTTSISLNSCGGSQETEAAPEATEETSKCEAGKCEEGKCGGGQESEEKLDSTEHKCEAGKCEGGAAEEHKCEAGQ